MKTTIKNVTLNEGKPKIIHSIVGTTEEEIIENVQNAERVQAELLEWRVDYFKDYANPEALEQAARKIKETTNLPLIFSLRSTDEQGKARTSIDCFDTVYMTAIQKEYADAYDIELRKLNQMTSEFASEIHKRGAKLILSVHNYFGMASENELLTTLKEMEDKGADAISVAYKPSNKKEVLNFMVTILDYNEAGGLPIFATAYGDMGMLTRFAGNNFGSSATYAVIGNSIEPGQSGAFSTRQTVELLSFDK